jgi:FMN phosphatase YigB (HAD superfamily)
MHPILDQHDTIAWDFDGTLVDGPNSAYFRSYISLNPQKRHHIITFRNRAWANTCWAELRIHGLDSKTFIRSVESCPEHFHDCYHVRRNTPPEYHEVFKEQHNYSSKQFNEYADSYSLWKAERASQIGCTILVDDMPQNVLPGCERHGIVFYHAHDLIR